MPGVCGTEGGARTVWFSSVLVNTLGDPQSATLEEGFCRSWPVIESGTRVRKGGPRMRLYGGTTRNRDAVLLLLLMIVSLAGCGSVVNPYLPFKREKPHEMTIGQAVAYADTVKHRYRNAIGDDATFNRLLGAGLVATATALPIMALTKASSKSLGIVGMSGAGVYAFGAWLQGEARQRAYIQGYSGVNCAIEVVLPLAFDPKQQPYKSFQDAMNGITARIAVLETAIANVKPEISVQMLETARTAAAEGREAHHKGIDVQMRIASAGWRLATTVDRIIGEVDTAIQTSASDLSTLSTIIGRLGSIYGEFPGVPTVSVFPTSDLSTRAYAGQPALGTTAEELAQKTADVASDTLIISQFVSLLPHVRPAETLKACRVDPETIVTAMSIRPNRASFSGARDKTEPFLVQGGVFPYMISIEGTDSNLISVDQPTSFGPSFTITVKAGAPAGVYALHVTDGSRRSTWLRLEVAGAESEEDTLE